MHGQQPPPPPHGYVPVVYRDPHDYYTVGQDDKPGYLHEPGRDNPQAITGFSFGVSGLGLLVLSGGISFLISIPCGIVAMIVGRRGMKAVDTGAATRHRRYAKAGFVTGLVTCGFAAFMGVSLILAAIFPDEFDSGSNEFTALPLVAAVMRFVSFATGS